MQRTSMPLALSKPFWLFIMIAASVTLSLGFACVTPFVAFGAFAALTLNRRDALLFTGAVWLVNQAVGYAVLGYPVTANGLAWGASLGFAAALAAVAAGFAGRLARNLHRYAVPLAAFAAAFVVYEGVLYAEAVTLLGGTETFAMTIVVRILEINAIAMPMLLLLNQLAMPWQTAKAGTGARSGNNIVQSVT